MAEGLPEGLVTTNEAVKGNIQSVDRVDAEDIARLWKGHRLENFFWRIWGNDGLLHNITGSLVATIFSRISEGGYIRTTPTQSPRSSRSLGTFDRLQQHGELYASPRPVLRPPVTEVKSTCGENDIGDAEETETESLSLSRKKLPPRPPPILKQSKPAPPPSAREEPGSTSQPGGSSASDPYRSIAPTRNAFSQVSEVPIRRSERSYKATRFKTDEVSLPTPSYSSSIEDVSGDSPRSCNKGEQKPAKRKTTVVASTIARKRRPAIRSRSSQSSSSSASVKAESLTGSELVVDDSTEERPSENARETIVSVNHLAPRLASDLNKAIRKGENRTKGPEPDQGADDGEPGSPGSRSTSDTQTTPRLTSFTSILRKPKAVAAAAASYQATGTIALGMDPTSGKDFPNSSKPGRESSMPSLPGYPLSRSGITGNNQNMPRTKSQLTLLLQRDQKSSSD
ncbi:MAG: hypothetical protein Q9170_000191 [Blastenia crenularia]